MVLPRWWRALACATLSLLARHTVAIAGGAAALALIAGPESGRRLTFAETQAEAEAEAEVLPGAAQAAYCKVFENVTGLTRGMYVCAPRDVVGPLPLFIFAHGHATEPKVYRELLRTIAASGFVVASYRECLAVPCAWWLEFLEVLRVIDVFSDPSFRLEGIPAVDAALPPIVSGHSEGGRAAIMAAAIKDSPEYLKGTIAGEALDRDGGRLRKAASRIGALVALHPDPMMNPFLNPDIPRFHGAISKTPLLEVCSAFDVSIAVGSCWYLMDAVTSPDRIFWVLPTGMHDEIYKQTTSYVWISRFAKAYALGDAKAKELLIGDCPDCMRHAVPRAFPGEWHVGPDDISLLICSSDREPQTAHEVQYCTTSGAKSNEVAEGAAPEALGSTTPGAAA